MVIKLPRMKLKKLKDYFSLQRGNAQRLAAALSLSKSYLSQVASGATNCPFSLAVAIERETEGFVMRWDLRPNDWWQVWPEFIGHHGAPAVPSLAYSRPTFQSNAIAPLPIGLVARAIHEGVSHD